MQRLNKILKTCEGNPSSFSFKPHPLWVTPYLDHTAELRILNELSNLVKLGEEFRAENFE